MCSSHQLLTRILKTSLKGRQNRTLSVAESAVVELETQSIESADFTTTTWKDGLQKTLAVTSDRLNEKITENKQQMEIDLNKIFKKTQRFLGNNVNRGT